MVITVSDRCASGAAPDLSGPAAARRLADAGHSARTTVVPDGVEAVTAALRAALDAGARVIVTTGGTGIAPRDLTPEGTEPVLERRLPGIGEAIRRAGERADVPTALLSRGLAGTAGRAFVLNAPGSVGGVEQALDVVLPLLPHILDQLDGGDHG